MSFSHFLREFSDVNESQWSNKNTRNDIFDIGKHLHQFYEDIFNLSLIEIYIASIYERKLIWILFKIDQTQAFRI